jgi:hypothetical protein
MIDYLGSHQKDDNNERGGVSPAEEILFESSVVVRKLIRLSSRCEILCLTLPEDGVEIRFHRWSPEDTNATASFTLASESSGFMTDDRLGTLLTDARREDSSALWLPRESVVGRMDRHGRLKTFDDASVESWWEVKDAPTLHLRLEADDQATVYWPMVVFFDVAPELGSDLFELDDAEQIRLVKSDWFDASSPADLWKHFIDGSVFDPRDAGQGRFRCQQCAYAWWSYLEGLHRRSGKKHYRSLARAVAWSVRFDLEPDGSWHHGFWNEEPEVHSRMLWDGVRLLLSEHEAAPHAELLATAKKVATFAVENLTQELDDNRLWFLHDSVEEVRPLRVFFPVLGRTEQNSLCLNTHVQALCVLAQMKRVGGTDGDHFQDVYRRGLAALEAVLGLDFGTGPLNFVDRLLPRLFACKVPHTFAERVLRFLTFRLLVGAYWWARERSGSLVFPSGYLDRDVGLTMLADEYHIVNLKDLVELSLVHPSRVVQRVITDAMRFTASLDFARALERSPIWAEWSDVLEVFAEVDKVDIEIVRAQIHAALGGQALDTFCASCGLWCSGRSE